MDLDLHATAYVVADGIATVTLSRPDRLNAWTDRMGTEYAALLAAAADDPAVRVVVVTGAGRGFCAGADTRALDRLSDAGGYDRAGPPPPATATGRHPALAALDVPKPVIAAVNGPVAGVGYVLFLACDLRFAAAGAKLTTSFARLGLPAEHGASWLLARLVGTGRAADLLFSSRVVLGPEAEAMGLVNRSVPDGEALPAALAYAADLVAGCSPAALAAMKGQLRADLARPFAAAADEAVQLLDRMLAGPDFAEGVAAMTDRRPPRFAPLPPSDATPASASAPATASA